MLFFAVTALTIWAVLGLVSYFAIRRQGGLLPVDNDRDINPRHFSQVLRRFLKKALEPEWGETAGHGWLMGKVPMQRREETIAVYRGNLALEWVPPGVSAICITGHLTLPDSWKASYDIWCLGDIIVGNKCHLRSVAAEGSITIGDACRLERWLDAEKTITFGTAVTVAAAISAGKEVVLAEGFTGGKISAPWVRVREGMETIGTSREAINSLVDHWQSVAAAAEQPVSMNDKEMWWQKHRSVCTAGNYWIGPNTVLLHDVICRGTVELGPQSTVVGDLHAEGDVLLGEKCLVTGNVACSNLIMEQGAVVAGSVHVDGDVLLKDNTAIGVSEENGGLAATGSIQITGQVAVNKGISAGGVLFLEK